MTAPVGTTASGTEGPLYDPSRHEPLSAQAWNEERARLAINTIVEETHRAFETSRGWPPHPLDSDGSTDDPKAMLYFGAAGVIWALHHLEAAGASAPGPLPYHDLLLGTLEANRKEIAPASEGVTSYLMGDAGILMTQYRLTQDDALLNPIADALSQCIKHTSRELLWGAPGTMIAALLLHQHTADQRFANIYREAADALWSDLERSPTAPISLWNQKLYGLDLWCLGAGHGFATNMGAYLMGQHLLESKIRDRLISEIEQTLTHTAHQADGLANWQRYLPPYCERTQRIHPEKCLVQFCHGAPGFIILLDHLPQGQSPTIDKLLQNAAELTWQAGPLRKGPGLCHGTAGNGYALLKLYKRTQHKRWLHRARRFAMHAIDQVQAAADEHEMQRHSLYTGDVGVACYLWSCIQEDAAFPTLDFFF